MAIKTISQLDKVMQEWAVKETQKMQNDLYTSIRAETPVKTGKAQAGWVDTEVKSLGDTGLIENDVDYIGWIEFDTDNRPGHYMVTRNIKRVVS
jgi:hypothetical protein